MWSINPAGAITGWVASNSGGHSYVRAPDGTFASFDAPGAVATLALNINPKGAISGQYNDASLVIHGFLRAPDGTITPFDAPGAGTGVGQGTTMPNGDKPSQEGAIAVNYISSGNNFSGTQVLRGAVRTPDGTFTEFDVPGAGTGGGQGTFGQNINTPGEFDGMYIDGSGVAHGFLRSKQGDITTFDVLGAGTASGQGTFAGTNNPAGAITGSYIDASFVQHGFLRIP